MRPTPTPVKTPPPTNSPPKHAAEKPQPQAGTVPKNAEELGHKGRAWRGR